MSTGALREAIIHFELYRLLKDCLDSGGFSVPCQVDVEPERLAGGRSVDLVLICRERGTCLSVIEVKGRSRGELIIYDEAVEEQARRYAEHLKAPYYIITNGVILRLFRYPCECVGNYYFQLSKTCVRQFLADFFSLYTGEKTDLNLRRAPSPSEIEKLTNALIQSIIEALEEISKNPSFRLETKIARETKNYYLSAGDLRRVFRLGIPLKDSREANTCVTIELNEMRRKLSEEDLKELLRNLSQIPGFEWITGINLKRRFVWKYMVYHKRVDVEKVKKELAMWFISLLTK